MASSASIMEKLGYQSKELRDLDNVFSDIYRKPITCFYETRRTAIRNLPLSIVSHQIFILTCILTVLCLQLVVDGRSASIFGQKNLPLDTNHSGLNKYASADDNGYKLIVHEIQYMISKLNAEDDIPDCLESLKPVDCETLLSHIPKPTGDTCNWIKAHVDRFCLEKSSTLFITGGPGHGKSVLARFIKEYLEMKESIQVCYFIFKDQNKQDTTAEAAIATLIHQLLYKNHNLYSHIKASHDDRARKKRDWTLQLLWEAFEKMISSTDCKSTIILIDGLDECEQSSRAELLRHFASSRHQTNKGRLIITTRPSNDLDTLGEVTLIDLSTEAKVTNAVKTFIDVEVALFFKQREGFDQDVQKKVQDHLRSNAGGMFLWVKLVMDRLRVLPSSSPASLEEELEELPKELIPIYEKLFFRGLTEYKKSVQQKLPWILYARRTLKLQELREALAVQDYYKNSQLQPGKDKRSGKDWRRWLSTDIERDLARNFGPLVVIEQSSAIRLVHQSLRGALLGQSSSSTTLRNICRSPEEEHAEIAAACLTYLSLLEIDIEDLTLPDERFYSRSKLTSLLRKYPLLEYAAQNWPDHVKSAGGKSDEISKRFQLLAAGDNINIAFQILLLGGFRYYIEELPALQIAAFLGLGWLGIELVHSGADVHTKSKTRGTSAMHRAAGGGALDLMALLLEKGFQ